MSDLSDVCKNMGIKDAFDDKAADFTKLSPISLEVSKVLQKTMLEIDENGGQGAAVSGIEMDITMDDNVPVCTTIDRPFFFLISERSTGAVLFMGKVSQL